eukprot:3540442-Rhodomonas_salina.1
MTLKSGQSTATRKHRQDTSHLVQLARGMWVLGFEFALYLYLGTVERNHMSSRDTDGSAIGLGGGT